MIETQRKPRMVTVTCENRECRIKFEVRVSDRKRGWGRFHSKSCKARRQVQTQGDTRGNSRFSPSEMEGREEGWDGHKDSF